MPITPSGVATRAISSPFGCCQRASSCPIGSSSDAIASSPAAMASIRSALSVKRSMKAALTPFSVAFCTSFAFVAMMVSLFARISSALFSKAERRASCVLWPSIFWACRAAATMSETRAFGLSKLCVCSVIIASPRQRLHHCHSSRYCRHESTHRVHDSREGLRFHCFYVPLSGWHPWPNRPTAHAR